MVLDDPPTATNPDLHRAVADVVRFGRAQRLSSEDGRHLAGALSHRLVLGIAEQQRAGRTREEIADAVRPAWDVHAESPFIRRLQTWPRGYPGDFETVEHILEHENRATPGRLSYWLEQHALDSPIAQQHRNKVDLQARAILEAVFASASASREPRILILAAGSSPDLRQVQTILSAQRFRVVLLDQDDDALRFGADRLPLLRDRLKLVQRNVVRGPHDVKVHGPFDLVLAGGLFDYLPDRVAGLVLRHAREHLLVDGGRFVFTNIADQNPYRTWIEYLGDWRLIHRSEAALRQLCADAGFRDTAVSVTFERTRLAAIVSCQAA